MKFCLSILCVLEELEVLGFEFQIRPAYDILLFDFLRFHELLQLVQMALRYHLVVNFTLIVLYLIRAILNMIDQILLRTRPLPVLNHTQKLRFFIYTRQTEPLIKYLHGPVL